MKKGINFWVLLIVIVAGIVVGLGINSTNLSKLASNDVTKVIDPYERFRSNNEYPEQEEVIKNALDSYMYRNFSQYYQTSWFDSVSATDAVINDYGNTFIIQSKSNEDNMRAEKFYGAALGFFNAKTTEAQYLVDRVILIDQDFNILKEMETVKW